MKTRPVSVSVIAWLLIVMGGATAASIIASINNPLMQDLMNKSPMPIPVQYALSSAGFLVMIVSGIGMLRGMNWARFLYMIYCVLSFVAGFLTSPAKALLIPSFVVFVVMAFFLFRKQASEYFSPSETSRDE